MRTKFVFLGSCSLCLVAGCSTVPTLEEATGTAQSEVFIGDVVKRVKCEVTDAFADRINEPDFQWMADWTAKIDLTLQANNSGGVTPGVTYTKYLKNAFNFDAGSNSLTSKTISAVNQFFSIGAGANLGEQAIRAEVVSFTLSLRELSDWKYPPRGVRSDYAVVCPRPRKNELRDDLGLKQWIDSALSPVAKDLHAGNHPSPVSINRPAAPPGATHAQLYAAGTKIPYEEALTELRKATSDVADALTGAKSNVKKMKDYPSQIRKSMKKYLAIMEPSLKLRLDANIVQLESMNKKADAEVDTITHLQSAVSAILDGVQMKSGQPVESENIQTAKNDARDATRSKNYTDDLLEAAVKAVGEIQKIDPPLDSLLHSVEFILSYGATLSPGWTLLEWKGPSPASGSAFSASGQRTHVLNIALGAVGNAEQNRLIQNQTVASQSH